MKKPYSKPQIAYVSFELSQSIAAGCEFISNNAYEACPITVEEGFVLFSTGACLTTPVDVGMDKDRFCYHIPSDDSRVFSS